MPSSVSSRYSLSRRERRDRSVSMIVACWKCGASDCRGPSHKQGCPELAPVPKARLLQIAAECYGGEAEAARPEAREAMHA